LSGARDQDESFVLVLKYLLPRVTLLRPSAAPNFALLPFGRAGPRSDKHRGSVVYGDIPSADPARAGRIFGLARAGEAGTGKQSKHCL